MSSRRRRNRVPVVVLDRDGTRLVLAVPAETKAEAAAAARLAGIDVIYNPAPERARSHDGRERWHVYTGTITPKHRAHVKGRAEHVVASATSRETPVRLRPDPEAVAQAVDALDRMDHPPQPPLPEGGRPVECSPRGKAWAAEYQAALDDAQERAAIELGDDADEVTYLRRVRDLLKDHPRFGEWDSLESECVKQWRSHHAKRQRRTTTSTSETKERLRHLAAEKGETITGSAAHLDELSPRGRAGYWRRQWKRTGSTDALARARRIEAEIRASKRGRGVRTHSAG